MDFSNQISNLFKPRERPHSPTAELSVKEGKGCANKDFQWLETNIPCQAACPAGTDIPGYLTAIADGEYEKAYRINLIDNIFPAVLGRVCSRPCESVCRHGYDGLGDPVAICFSKRSADDFSTQQPVILEPWFPASGKTVAVIGAGVAGLTAARQLKLMGHDVTVYEKHAAPGGMLNQGIPEFRLPREIIDREIAQITGLGIEIKCGVSIGDDVKLTDLIAENDAVVMAAGTLKPNLLNLPNHELPGILHGLDFLLQVNEGEVPTIGKNVVVIGGGFTAMDCARTARRLGADTAQWDLKVLYRRSKEVMRVTPGELEELDTEGIPLECHATPVAYLEKDGRLAGMKFRRTGSHEEFDVPADTVLLATGQFPDHSWECETEDFQSLEHFRKVFAAGDYASGASSLIDAIGHAKETADQVDEFLMGGKRREKSVKVEAAETTGRTREMDKLPRNRMPMLPVAERSLMGEVETGYREKDAAAEASRCYRCHFKFEIDQDKCIKCDWCLKARPRPECILMLKSIEHDDEGRAVAWESTDYVREMNLIWINQDECIRCGACLKACPVDAISLQKVSLFTDTNINNTGKNTENS
ncbi:FAD-dependent oxidoreductase [Pontiella sp.]|uniref:FAD-dependent oxidoreductase n=1 Tax=Pontiella sp. TaxID=2837462 RepID=UPI0035659FB7